MTLFVGSKPFKVLSSNRIELLNEFLVSSVCYSCIIATDYHHLVDKKYEGAWFLILVITLTLFINIMIVTWSMLRGIRLMFIRFCVNKVKVFYRKHKLIFEDLKKKLFPEPKSLASSIKKARVSGKTDQI